MKMICDVPDEVVKSVKVSTWCGFGVTEKIIANGQLIPDDATNGDVIKAMFPDAEIHFDGNDVFIHHMGFWIKYNIRWWNAPHQKG